MQGGLSNRLVCLLAAGVLAACSAGVLAQDDPGGMSYLGEEGLGFGSNLGTPLEVARQPSGQFVSDGMMRAEAKEPPDLAARVKDLEAALKKIKDKEEADKKKAAGKPSVTASGRIHFDMNRFSQNAASMAQVGDLQSGVGFRRARLRLLGDAFDVISYCAEFDFAGSPGTAGSATASYKDVYIQVNELPYVGHFRVGHFKEPFGLEQLTSSNYISFMERSVNDEGAIVPGRDIGAMLFNATENERATAAIGVFTSDPRQVDNPPFWLNDNGGYALTARATLLPWYDEATNGRGLVHLGAAYSYRDNDAAVNYRFRTRPEASLSPRVIDLQLANVDYVQLLGGEAAAVYGPLSVQGEYFSAYVERTAGNIDPAFHGGYAFVSYFLTGEHRPYRRANGCFDRVKPHENFFLVRDCDGCVRSGKGAWELLYRFSYLDMLDNLPIAGPAAANGAGWIADHTVGVNWYLNPYTRVMFNYVWTHMSRVTNNQLISGGRIETLEMRAQIDF